MKKTLLVLAALLIIPVITVAQNLPKIGEVMSYSKNTSKLTTGCPLTFNTRVGLFECMDLTVHASVNGSTMSIERGEATVIVADATGKPSFLRFDDEPAGRQYASADILFPSFDFEPVDLTFQWHADTSGNIQWEIEWCRYSEGEAPCTPDDQNTTLLPASTGTAGLRADVVVSMRNSYIGPSDRVVFSFSRVYNSVVDTVTNPIYFEGMGISIKTSSPN